MRVSERTVAGLLFGSGLSALVYQTAWQRMLRLVFGASTSASAAVLAVFLGGLGVGGVLLGGRVERSARPLAFYGNLELGVALTAAVSPLSVLLLGKPYLALGGSEGLGPAIATVLRLVIAMVAIGPSVVLMGGTLPAAARAVTSTRDAARASLSLLYAANTLGAVVGALLGTFVLFEILGTRLSLFSAALLNGLVALVARSMGRSAEEIPPGEAATGSLPSSRGSGAVAYAVAFGVGFAFLLLEIVWYRLLAPVLGGSAYTFGLVLATALAGIGLGGWLYSRRSEDRRATLPELATVTILEGVLVALPLALGDRIALYAAMTRPMANLGFAWLVASWASVTLLVVFPASLVSGYQFPLLFALLGEGRKNVAREVGRVYAWNTGGAIVGSLLGGFVLLPRLSAVGAFRLVALTLLSLGLVSGGAALSRGGLRTLPRLATALGLAALCGFFATRTGPTAIWRHEPIGAGRAHPPTDGRNGLRAWMLRERASIVWQADGVETAVALKKADQLAFVVDGKTDGAVFEDRATQATAGLMGALVHPNPKRAFVIGLGTGMSAGWLAAVPGMERVDVAELEPSILEIARAARAANLDVLRRRNVQIHLGDGRELLLASRARYDLIVSEPSNPYRAGISALYTAEFYDAVRTHLNESGVFVQWVQGYEIDAETMRTIIRTLRSVFGDVEAWQTEYGDVLFLSAEKARVLSVKRLARLVDTEPYRSALVRTMLVSDVEGFLSHFVANDALLRRVSELPGVAVNTDDEDGLDYAFARAAGTADHELPLSLLRRAQTDGMDRPAVDGDVDWARVQELRPRIWLAGGGDTPRLPQADREADARVAAITLGCRGRAAEGARAWAGQTREPRDDLERFVVGAGRADAGSAEAEAYAAALSARGLVAEAELLRTRLALHGADSGAAKAAATRAIEAMRVTPLPLCSAGRQILSLVRAAFAGTADGAKEGALLLLAPFAASALDAERSELAVALATRAGDAALCVRALGEQVEHPRWDEEHLRTRLRCLAAAKHPLAERALTDLAAFFQDTSGTFEERR
ncbi:MAG TPA: fused MFS/spermidine synthase [Polyangiaceae bacterium]|nr:fused MFS/spermidine synthase [Polyangiaceae bacterium]